MHGNGRRQRTAATDAATADATIGAIGATEIASTRSRGSSSAGRSSSPASRGGRSAAIAAIAAIGAVGTIGAGAIAAISAIGIALWARTAKALGVPLYELLGGLVRDRVVCYPHIAAETTEGLVTQACEKVAAGWKFVRFDLPSQGEILEPTVAVREGVRQFAAIREAVGEAIEICIDVHLSLIHI